MGRLVIATTDQERFYKKVLKALTEEATGQDLGEERGRVETAKILARRMGKGHVDFYVRVLEILTQECAGFGLGDELDRIQTARALAKDW